jgi:hypothetical protein
VTQETVNDGVVLLVLLSVLDVPVSVPAVMSGVPVAAGAMVSIVIVSAEEFTDTFPAVSVCLALIW